MVIWLEPSTSSLRSLAHAGHRIPSRRKFRYHGCVASKHAKKNRLAYGRDEIRLAFNFGFIRGSFEKSCATLRQIWRTSAVTAWRRPDDRLVLAVVNSRPFFVCIFERVAAAHQSTKHGLRLHNIKNTGHRAVGIIVLELVPALSIEGPETVFFLWRISRSDPTSKWTRKWRRCSDRASVQAS